MLEPAEVETPLGQAEVRQLFKASRIGTIAGSLRHRGDRHARRQRARRARRHGHLRHHDRKPAPLQRGRPRGQRRLRVRDRAGQLPGRPRGRSCSRPMRRGGSSASSPPDRPRCWQGPATRRGIGGHRMSTPRMRRVDEAIRQVIGDAIAGGLKDPRIGFLTVTDVRTSPDLRHARVYVSVLGAARRARPASAEREATLEGLRSAHGYLQGRLAAELRLKRTPTLEFVYDDTTDRALRVRASSRARAEQRERQPRTPPRDPRAGARADPRRSALRARLAREARRRRARLDGRHAGPADARSARTR